MHTLPKVLWLCSSASFALLLLPSLVECSSRENKQTDSHNSIQQHEDYHRTLDIALHGILLWASMGFLMPVGVLIIRMASTKEYFHQTRFKFCYYVHASLQVLSAVLATAAAVISIRKFENAFNNCHQRVGLALYGAICFQVLCGFRRPKRGSKSRRVWYFFHWILGTAIPLVGIFNTYTGLKAYHIKMSKSISIWSILFTAQVAFMAFFYLFQDKWDYIQKQGVALGSELEAPSLQIITQGHNNDSRNNNNKKEALATEPRRNSNSLGTYFSRSTALNKLFQLT